MRVASILIDNIIKNQERVGKVTEEIKGVWYLARPYDNYHTFFRRIRGAWRVLIGKSMAVHYKIDE